MPGQRGFPAAQADLYRLFLDRALDRFDHRAALAPLGNLDRDEAARAGIAPDLMGNNLFHFDYSAIGEPPDA